MEPGPSHGVWVLDRVYSRKNTKLGRFTEKVKIYTVPWINPSE